MFFAKNLKFLRKRRHFSQQELSVNLEINRTTLSSYESGVQPPFKVQVKISDYFKISIDALIKYDLSQLGEFQLSEIEKGFDIDITGQKLRMLTLTVNEDGKENISMVNIKAQAGYTAGYGDPDYLENLPRFQLPFLTTNKTYRSFQIEGDSMTPIVASGDWVTAEYVEDWSRLKAAHPHIVITKNDGIVLKYVYLKMKDRKLLLSSANPFYSPYELPIEDVLEIWKAVTYNGFF